MSWAAATDVVVWSVSVVQYSLSMPIITVLESQERTWDSHADCRTAWNHLGYQEFTGYLCQRQSWLLHIFVSWIWFKDRIKPVCCIVTCCFSFSRVKLLELCEDSWIEIPFESLHNDSFTMSTSIVGNVTIPVMNSIWRQGMSLHELS